MHQNKWNIIFDYYGTSAAANPATGIPGHTVLPKGSDSEAAATDKDKLKAGDQVLVPRFELGEGSIISGVASCDQACTLTVWQGKSPFLFSIKQDFTVPADFSNGAGVKIGPIDVVGEYCKITINNAGAATYNFLCQIRAKEVR